MSTMTEIQEDIVDEKKILCLHRFVSNIPKKIRKTTNLINTFIKINKIDHMFIQNISDIIIDLKKITQTIVDDEQIVFGYKDAFLEVINQHLDLCYKQINNLNNDQCNQIIIKE